MTRKRFHELIQEHGVSELKEYFDVLVERFDGRKSSTDKAAMNLLHRKIFQQLRSMKPEINNEILCVEIEVEDAWEYVDDGGVTQFVEREEWNELYCIQPGDETKWAMDFIPWAKILGMIVSEDRLDVVKDDKEFIAEVVWEITFWGYDEKKINAKCGSLCKTVQDYENGTAKTYSQEEFDEKMRSENAECS